MDGSDLAEGLRSRLAAVRARIDAAARTAGRDPAEVRLLAVSKTVPADVVRLAVEAGCEALGESRAQELTAKAADLADLAPRWAFLGPLQTNKARDVAAHAHELHSLDRPALAETLQRRLDAADRMLEVLVQVNTSGEAAKSGVAPADAESLVRAAAGYDRLHVRGLMTIATRGGDDAEARRCFRELAAAAARVREAGIDGVGMDELSMGMSGDLEVAIEEGATTVRVGTAIFGAR
ncbi:YggS family pyridoxal phosphate-dependent enzyme [Litorihabitans aurantiacus]|uniref:Pyridoxal phosphate homeostasis protein n=1 Tax=Litorihabitans aurantiacus TaxID=1930061 RepID=A0AA37XH31_9MICO|nr:YggS family pyridoxal phosphate-dependent enzyme [Litorihabitans aurantiacus]GMA32842.1 YggS family pyridoxal phosphate enzyme [Litorihabitans aurantiacus]